MTIKVHGEGYGKKEVEYKMFDMASSRWVPISGADLNRLLKMGNVIWMNPRI